EIYSGDQEQLRRKIGRISLGEPHRWSASSLRTVPRLSLGKRRALPRHHGRDECLLRPELLQASKAAAVPSRSGATGSDYVTSPINLRRFCGLGCTAQVL